jgi:hypothetical protein
MKELKIRDDRRLFDPVVTLWAFLPQVLDADKSCHNAVSKIIAYLAGTGLEAMPTAGYANAKIMSTSRLNATVFEPIKNKILLLI